MQKNGHYVYGNFNRVACPVAPAAKNNFYILHSAIVVLSAYYIETHYFKCTPFVPKTFLLFVVFQLVSINLVTVLAYYVDKRAARKGAWRVPEANLHTLEFLGGWPGALLAQKIFRHKTKNKVIKRLLCWLLHLNWQSYTLLSNL